MNEEKDMQNRHCLINSREAIAVVIEYIVVFYNSKNLNCIGALSFLKFCSHIFMIFMSNWSSDFGHDKTGSGAKKPVVLRCEFFCSNFNGV